MSLHIYLGQIPPYFKLILEKQSKKEPLSYSEMAASWTYSWTSQPYAKLCRAQTNQTLYFFRENQLLFDYSKEKIGGVLGNYPTINGHKIRWENVPIQCTQDTQRMEIIGEHPHLLVVHFNNLTYRAWTVFNQIVKSSNPDDKMGYLVAKVADRSEETN
jgi:hypothetical protein